VRTNELDTEVVRLRICQIVLIGIGVSQICIGKSRRGDGESGRFGCGGDVFDEFFSMVHFGMARKPRPFATDTGDSNAGESVPDSYW
jgi:hypothetical protein